MKNVKRDLYIYNLYIYNLQFDECPVFYHLINQSTSQPITHPINQIATKKNQILNFMIS
jgi:hypothetical protein